MGSFCGTWCNGVVAVQLLSRVQLRNPIDCNTPGFPILLYLPEFVQIHVHPTISSCVVPFPSCLQSFPASGSFPMNQLWSFSFRISPSSEYSGLISLGLTGLTFLLSKGISRVGAAYGNLDMYEQCHPTIAEARVGPKDNTQHGARVILTVSSALKQTRPRSPAPLPVPGACLPSSVNATHHLHAWIL